MPQRHFSTLCFFFFPWLDSWRPCRAKRKCVPYVGYPITHIPEIVVALGNWVRVRVRQISGVFSKIPNIWHTFSLGTSWPSRFRPQKQHWVRRENSYCVIPEQDDPRRQNPRTSVASGHRLLGRPRVCPSKPTLRWLWQRHRTQTRWTWLHHPKIYC